MHTHERSHGRLRSPFGAGARAAVLLGLLVSCAVAGLRAQDAAHPARDTARDAAQPTRDAAQDAAQDAAGSATGDAAPDPGDPAPAGSLMQEARTHVGHIMEEWPEAPEGRGLLDLAIAESQAVARHATLATRDPGDLHAMKAHAVHALQALDPTRAGAGEAAGDRVGDGVPIPEDVGLGEGYGFRRAASDIALEARLAEAAPGATPGIQTHADVVAVSAENAAGWAEEMIGVVEEIRTADTAPEAAPLVARLKELSDRLVSGHDLNDDEEILWQDGEGGIMHVQMHMSLLTRVEGRWYFRDRGTVPAPGPQR